MASQLIVVDAQMKRAVIKVTPSKPLSEVLAEACTKLGYKSEQFGLKHNNKTVDLSRSIRLSGLNNNAKLELVQASRSPSVVSVALQLPALGGAPSTRLTDKFPSDTPIWQILRRFEAGAAGGPSTASSNHNFTQRATPLMAEGASSGSGRLCYEMPVVNIMNRDLGSFTDLQKTLGQLGFNSGTCLLRLSYKNTQMPLEEAMTEISRYFKEVEESKATPAKDGRGTHSGAVNDMVSKPDVNAVVDADIDAVMTSLPAKDETKRATLGQDSTVSAGDGQNAEVSPVTSEKVKDGESANTAQPSVTNESPAPLSKMEIYTPSSSATPVAAAAPHNEDDYNLSIAQAQQYQALLNKASRNRRLLSDKELADQEQARKDALNAVTSIRVALRLPDTSRVTKGYDRTATTSDLYAQAREVLNRPKDEAFTILSPGQRNPVKDDGRKLIADLGWTGSVLVTVEWSNPGEHQGPVLKEMYLKQAHEIKVQQQLDTGSMELEPAPEPAAEASKSKKAGKEVDKEERMKKLMAKMGFKK